MRGYEKILVSIAVALPLAGLFVAAPLLRPDTGDLNRNPVPFPEVGATDFVNGEGFSAVGSWLRDRVPLRRALRRLDARIDNGVFGDLDTLMVLQGRDGWVFFEHAIGRGLEPDYDPATLRAGIARLKDEVEAAGKTFLYAVAPHKPTIYADHLGERDRRRQTVVRERLERFRALMRRAPVEGFIDAWDDLERAAKQSPEPLYHPRDTHWTTPGAAVMTRAIVDHLAPGLSASLAIARGKPREVLPDLVRYAGLDRTEPADTWIFRRPGVRWKRAGAERAGKAPTVRYTATARDGARLLPKIAVICDSYGTALHPSLRLFFSSTTFIHTVSIDTELARKALAEADIVLFLRAERFIWQTSAQTPFAEDSDAVLTLLSTLGRRS